MSFRIGKRSTLPARSPGGNKRHERRPVPITGALASVLKQEAAG